MVSLAKVGAAAAAPAKLAPYELLSVVDQKRLKCQKLKTTYAPDFIVMYEEILSKYPVKVRRPAVTLH